MDKIAIIGHASAGSCLISALESKLAAQCVEPIINNNVDVKKSLRSEPEPFVFKERDFFTEPKYYDIKPSKFISKPKNNFKKN